jgi:dipeptidyl aminopeptidase/acylaminoacyl peptidase
VKLISGGGQKVDAATHSVLVLLIAATAAIGIPTCSLLRTRPESGDLHRLHGRARVSPDGAKILHHETREGQRHTESSIWIWDVANGKTSPLLPDGRRGSKPRWSPDGKWVAYIGNEGDREGLIVARADGSAITFLSEVMDTNHPLPATGERLSWSPDSRSIAFVSAVPGPETEEATGDPIVIRRYLYKPTAGEGLTRFNDNRRLHIFIVDVASRSVRQLTDGTGYEHSIDWSPSGEEILFVSNWEPDPDFFNYDVFAVKVFGWNGSPATVPRTSSTTPAGHPRATVVTRVRGGTGLIRDHDGRHAYLADGRDGGNRREVG